MMEVSSVSQEVVTAGIRQIQFEDLKPICCAVMKSPSEENFIELDKILDKISIGSLSPEITNYILFPLVVHLKSINLLKASVRILLLRCISDVLSKGTVENLKCFMDLFQTFSMILGLKGNVPSVNFNENLEEDLVDQVELALYLLLKNITCEHGDTLFQEPYVKSIGHAIYMQLQIIGSNFPLQTRCRALTVVELVFNMASNSESRSKCMLNFLPGVVIALRKVASVRQGNFKSELALQALALFPKVIFVATANQPKEDLVKVDDNLSILLSSLSEELISCEDVRIRENLSHLSRQIISQRSSQLPKLTKSSLWKNILNLCWDEENETIALPCRQFLTENPDADSIFDFDKILENLKALKSHYLSGNLDEATANLKFVASSLCVMKLSFIEISTLFPPLVSFLTLAIAKNEFDLDKEAEEVMFRRNPLLRACDNLCMSFSLAADLSDIMEEYLPYLSINATVDFTQRLENNLLGALYVFNKILLTNLSTTSSSKKGLDLSNVFTLYLEILDQQVLDRAKVPSPKVATILEYESILIVVGLGLMCRADSNVISSTLYHLLEQAGNDYSEILARVATNVVQLIAKYQNMQSLEELLVVNLDLILSEVSVRVGSISSYPNCPSALIFLAKYFDFGKGTFTQIIHRAFTQSCDNFYPTSAQTLFAKIFYAYMTSLWNQRGRISFGNPDNITPVLKFPTLSQKLWHYQCSLGIEIGSISEEDETPQDPNAEEQVMDVEESLSDELKLVLNICERVLNFLPTHPQDSSIQINSIDTLILGIQLLQRHENALLPLAHKIWLNLSSRFTDTSMIIIKKSFELLVTLCKCSGSFLRKRVVQEVFPKLSSILVTLGQDSAQIEHKNLLYYTHTQSFKLQLSVLEGLAELCLSIELSEEELDQVVTSCLMYVKPQQHKKLKEAAIKVMDNLTMDTHSSSVIWMKLVAHGLRKEPANPPHPDFRPLLSSDIQVQS